MSGHHFAIAKASFAAGLLRPGTTKVGRDDLTTFHSLLEAAITTCTTHHIQKCKEWIATNIASSATRTAAFGKYLTSYSKYTQQELQDSSAGRKTSASRKKLHILYIIHDVAHHTKNHLSDSSTFSTFTASIQPFLADLVHSVALERRVRTFSRLHMLLEVWDGETLFPKDYVRKLRQAIAENGASQQESLPKNTISPPVRKEANETEFVMPTTHGDPATPFYDLPAGNLLPFLEPGLSAPIPPEQIRPLQFAAGPADKPLVNALKDFLKDVESIDYRPGTLDNDVDTPEVDQLGQITTRDEAGDIAGDTYYGWSRAFCEKMKRRRKGMDSDHDRRRSLSKESTRSSSPSPRKRQRYSGSGTSRSASRSRSPPRFRAMSPSRVNTEPGRWQLPQAPRQFEQRLQPGLQPPLSMLINLPPNPAHFPAPPLGLNGLPIPPPRPPNWNGPWPPPPPVSAPFGPPQIRQNNSFPPPPPPGYPAAYAPGYR